MQQGRRHVTFAGVQFVRRRREPANQLQIVSGWTISSRAECKMRVGTVMREAALQPSKYCRASKAATLRSGWASNHAVELGVRMGHYGRL